LQKKSGGMATIREAYSHVSHGVVVVDKPTGLTSFDVVARVRRSFGHKRVGHTGTLDPMASGVLPICLGEATKLVPFLMAGDKTYEAEALLGVTTDTLDATGRELTRRDASGVRRADVERVLPEFTGMIPQIPPMHSALHVNGRRLYEMARAGENVTRVARLVRVLSLELLDFSWPRLRLQISCGKGTYIRSLVDDIGSRLGVGAHLLGLRRTRSGRFHIASAYSLPAVIEGEGRIPFTSLAEALSDWPTLTLESDVAREVRDGKKRVIEALSSPCQEGWVRLLREDGTLLAAAEAHQGKLRLLRVFC
jgi:tRNA pseudouridine55 synthase